MGLQGWEPKVLNGSDLAGRRLQPVGVGCNWLQWGTISEQLQPLDTLLGPNSNWKSGCFRLQLGWVAGFFQFLQLDLQTLGVPPLARICEAEVEGGFLIVPMFHAPHTTKLHPTEIDDLLND